MRHLNHQVNKNKQRKAEYFAGNWGSEWVNAGYPGHINPSSGLRNRPFGISQLQKLIQL